MLQPVKELASRFPGSLCKARKLINLGKDKFTKFVCCPDCGKLYNYTDAICFDNKTKQNISKTCDNIPYPNHPRLKMRNPCGAILMKTGCSHDGKKLINIQRKYAFQSLKNALSLLLYREDVVNAIKKRENLIRSDILRGITDGSFYQNLVDNNT